MYFYMGIANIFLYGYSSEICSNFQQLITKVSYKMEMTPPLLPFISLISSPPPQIFYPQLKERKKEKERLMTCQIFVI